MNMNMNKNMMNYNYNSIINIIFYGKIKEFDGYVQDCEWIVSISPLETVKNLIIKFYQISGLIEEEYMTALHRRREDWPKTLFQAGLNNNSKILVSPAREEECLFVPKEPPQYIKEAFKKPGLDDFKIFIKFIKYNQYSKYNCNTDLKGILKLCFLKEISSKFDHYTIGVFKNISEMVYQIMKILNQSGTGNEDNLEAKQQIEKVLNKEKGCNIINFSRFVDETINTQCINQMMNFLSKEAFKDINDIKFRLGKYSKFVSTFEEKFQRSLRESIFEFSVVSLVIIDRQDFDKFETERQNCNNKIDKILYHGTKIQPISNILTGLFRKSIDRHIQFGQGVYFTDNLDYCRFYGGPNDNREYVNMIPPIGQTFTAIVSLVYYNAEGFLKVKDYKTRFQPRKNEINFAYAGAKLETVENPNTSKFYATEYCVWDLDQICPFMSVKLKRDEYCVIWRDDNFSKDPVFHSKYDEFFKEYLRKRIKYIEQSAKLNVYPCITTEEALALVNRKKYNKIILIANGGGNNLSGRDFVYKARKIIGNNVLALISAYSLDHLKWIKDYPNTLFSNEEKFTEEFLDSFAYPTPKLKILELAQKLGKYYKINFNLDANFLTFPLYKDQGKYSDLTF